MGKEILIINGLIVNADKSQEADVLISNGKIKNIGKSLERDKHNIIDAQRMYIFPGGIDPHVHMHLPTPAGRSSDDFLSGSEAALFGGTTTIIDFVTPHRGQSLTEALKLRKAEAALSMIDYSFHVSPVEWRSSTAEEIKSCIENEGINSFKVYMAYKNNIGLEDDDLKRVMQTVGEMGGIVTIHCELGDDIEILRDKLATNKQLSPIFHPISRPPHTESEAVKKAINMAADADCPLYIVHVSCKESLEHISGAQQKGQNVWAETCPQYLLLDDSCYSANFEKAAAFVMSPPLRKKEDNEALWQSIAGNIIQTTGTDHCPFNLKQKEAGLHDFRRIPNGAGGVEHRLTLLYTYGVLQNRINLNKFVEITSTNAAKIFGKYPAKGIIQEGSDADLVIWNPETESIISTASHHQHSDLNIYEDFKTKGAPEYVIRAGEIVIEVPKSLTE